MLKTLLPQFPQLKTLGDTHLGRRFLTDVPLHRRGEREKSVQDHFCRALIEGVKPTDLVVQTGDIFDSFLVPLEVLLFAVRALENAAELTGATYYIYRGNHDGARDAERASSFDVLELFFHNHPTVHVVKDLLLISHGEMRVGFMPWHPFKSARELAQEMKLRLPENTGKMDVIYTHCDLDAIAGKDFNVLPADVLGEIADSCINGHIHEAEERHFPGINVYMPGSMEPYSHGEDPGQQFYITLSLKEFWLADHATFKKKNVRILLEEGETLPEEIPDCLSFTAKKAKNGVVLDEGDDSEQVVLQDFSMTNVISEALRTSGVATRISAQILEKFEETKNLDK